MAFLEFLDFLEFMETSTVAGPGPNPREIEISFGADGPLACVRGPSSTIGASVPYLAQSLSTGSPQHTSVEVTDGAKGNGVQVQRTEKVGARLRGG